MKRKDINSRLEYVDILRGFATTLMTIKLFEESLLLSVFFWGEDSEKVKVDL